MSISGFRKGHVISVLGPPFQGVFLMIVVRVWVHGNFRRRG